MVIFGSQNKWQSGFECKFVYFWGNGSDNKKKSSKECQTVRNIARPKLEFMLLLRDRWHQHERHTRATSVRRNMGQRTKCDLRLPEQWEGHSGRFWGRLVQNRWLCSEHEMQMGKQNHTSRWKYNGHNVILHHKNNFLAGDVGYYDETEHLFIVDRIKDVIKYKTMQVRIFCWHKVGLLTIPLLWQNLSTSIQVSPSEIEEVIYQHSAVKATCVVGVENDEAGEVPLACVILKEGQTVSEEEIIQLVAGWRPCTSRM